MFSVEEILVRVTHSEKAANEILASYGDGDSQAKQMAVWKKEGWKFDEAKSEWYWMHPVPTLCWKGETKLPELATLSEVDQASLQTCLDDLTDLVAGKVDAYLFANTLSSGYQYKTRPNLKKASTKGAAEAARQAKFDSLKAKFAKAANTGKASWGDFAAAMMKGEEAIRTFLETWSAGVK